MQIHSIAPLIQPSRLRVAYIIDLVRHNLPQKPIEEIDNSQEYQQREYKVVDDESLHRR